MAGIIAVYGLVVAVLIVGDLSPDRPYSLYSGFIHLAAGLSCGLTGLAAGHAIGIVGDAVRLSVYMSIAELIFMSKVCQGLLVSVKGICVHGSHVGESEQSKRVIKSNLTNIVLDFCRGHWPLRVRPLALQRVKKKKKTKADYV